MLAALPLSWLYAAAGSLVGLALRVRIGHVVVGVGPTVLSKGTWSVNVVPFGASVRFATRAAEGGDGIESDTLDAASRPARAALLGARVVAQALLGFALHPHAAALSIVRGVPQIVAGALAPLTQAREVLASAAAAVERGGTAALFAIVGARVCASNLVLSPFPPASSFLSAGGAPERRSRAAKWLDGAELAFLVAWFCAHASWLVAIARYALAN